MIVYVNSAAVGISAWFLASPIWKNADVLPDSLNVRKIMMKISAIAIVGLSTAAIPLLYNNGRIASGLSLHVFDGASVRIGDQVWMAENLNVTNFRNGDPIPEANSDEEWEEAGKEGKPAWCFAPQDSSLGIDFGKLYNWHAVNDPRGLAPEGWHIPADEEWTKLTAFLGGNKKAGVKMKSTAYWHDVKRSGGSGDNSSGFNGIPSGNKNSDGMLVNGTYKGIWWSSSEDKKGNVWSLELNHKHHHVLRESYAKGLGFSVRCIRDAQPDTAGLALNAKTELKDKDSVPLTTVDWSGTYTYTLEDQLIDYTLKINGRGSCTYQGDGVQTSFKVICKTRRKGDALEVYYTRTLEGAYYPADWIDRKRPIMTLYFKDGQLYTDEGQTNKEKKGGQLLFKKIVP